MPELIATTPGRHRLSTRLFFLFAFGLAALSLCGLMGRWDAWADVVNQFAPVWLTLSAVGLLAGAVFGSWRRSRATGALLVFAFVVQAAFAGPDWFHHSKDALAGGVGGGPPFSVLTFNVWNESTDHGAIIRDIVASGADVVTLQEALAIERISSKELSAAYPFRSTCDDWWGCEILILSKRPILDHHYAAPAPTGSGGPLWAVWVTTTAADGHAVRVLATHFAWPIPPGPRQAQVERLAEIVRNLGPRSLIVTCDCNASGASFALQQQDAELGGISRRTRAMFSWPAIIDGAHWTAPFPFLAIDQVYASDDWKTVGVRRLPRSSSDHYPILVKLARDQGAG